MTNLVGPKGFLIIAQALENALAQIKAGRESGYGTIQDIADMIREWGEQGKVIREVS